MGMVKLRAPHLYATSIFLLFMVLSLAVFFPAQAVQAQTPESTPQPTPAYQYGVTLGSGAEVLVVRSVTYGDIAIIVTLLVVALLILFYILLRSAHLWAR